MNIKELISSTNQVKNRGKRAAFQKKFGSIYLYNKTINVFKGGSAIVVNMMIGGVTDMIKSGGKKTPVAYHKVSLALNNISKEEYTAEELVQAVRLNHKKYADENEWPPQDVIQLVLDHPSDFFNEATVFPTPDGKDFVVLSNNIPEDSEIQVWCSCSDYYWTFQYYNMQTPCKDNRGTINLYGSKDYPKTYNYRSVRGRESKAPLRNPARKPGMCKHLMLLLAMLMKDGIVKDSKNGLTKFYRANYSKFIKGNKKERVSQTEYDNVLKSYRKDQRKLVEQRREFNLKAGNVVKRAFDAKRGKFDWEKNKRRRK